MIIKSMTELRQILSDEIEKVRSQKSTPQVLKAITNAIGKYLFSIKLELDYCKMAGKTPHMKVLNSGQNDLKVMRQTESKAA